MFSFNSLRMQHVSLAVGGPGGAEVESRLPRGDGVGRRVKVTVEQQVDKRAELLSAAARPAPSGGSPRL